MELVETHSHRRDTDDTIPILVPDRELDDDNEASVQG